MHILMSVLYNRLSQHTPGMAPPMATMDSKRALKEGVLFVIPIQMSVEKALPLEHGRVLEHYEGEVFDFQWLGNVAQSQNGRFQPAWYQDSAKNFYYKQHPIYKSHPLYTGKELNVSRKIKDGISVDEGASFLENRSLKA